jgi:hypothetical protein
MRTPIALLLALMAVSACGNADPTGTAPVEIGHATTPGTSGKRVLGEFDGTFDPVSKQMTLVMRDQPGTPGLSIATTTQPWGTGPGDVYLHTGTTPAFNTDCANPGTPDDISAVVQAFNEETSDVTNYTIFVDSISVTDAVVYFALGGTNNMVFQAPPASTNLGTITAGGSSASNFMAICMVDATPFTFIGHIEGD